MTKLAWRPEWQSLLSNGTVNNPANPPNNLTGIVYGEQALRYISYFFSSKNVSASLIGDYYFVKAGNELLHMNLANCP